ncbi:hypothetical protein [Paenibacillus jiagnxiensis]|uniref:hypothetical protein n=1 Tax=Paenibacillus jiagnxiensis TaxID=3228926 RepID=UPI0033A41D51
MTIELMLPSVDGNQTGVSNKILKGAGNMAILRDCLRNGTWIELSYIEATAEFPVERLDGLYVSFEKHLYQLDWEQIYSNGIYRLGFFRSDQDFKITADKESIRRFGSEFKIGVGAGAITVITYLNQLLMGQPLRLNKLLNSHKDHFKSLLVVRLVT